MAEELRETISLDELFAGLENAGQPKTPQRPFKLLDPYGPEDREIFFGREDETEQILSRFYRGRMLLVYGESGSGKSSLIQCGLRSSIPSVDMQFFSVRSAMNPFESLRKEILKQVKFRDRAVPEFNLELIHEAVFLKSKPLALIFDQFEELFLFQPPAVREKLAGELSNWLENEKNLRVIICIRAEHFSRLSEFESFLPDIYANKFWVRRMSRDQVYDVINGPCEKFGVAVEKALTRELVDRFTSGGEDVNLPILQVVLEKLYRMAVTGSQQRPSLTMTAYVELGRIENILSRMLEEIIKSHIYPDFVLQVFKAMVGIEGTKRISSKTEILKNASEFGFSLLEEDVDSILAYLIESRTVRQDVDSNLYELSHDVLAAPVYAMLT
ncbi:MAG: ATP-binding protein, partial [Desulfobacteraceae bacterium]|nr:ATP-binding protein [Desulfobacteraceae bacterium]